MSLAPALISIYDRTAATSGGEGQNAAARGGCWTPAADADAEARGSGSVSDCTCLSCDACVCRALINVYLLTYLVSEPADCS